MAAIFEDIGNFQKDGTCHFCAVQGETVDVTTASDLLQGVPMCLRCFSKLIPPETHRDGRPTARKAGRPSRRNGQPTTVEAIPEATLVEPAASGTPATNRS